MDLDGLDCRVLCALKGRELVQYLRNASGKHSESAISSFLLQAIESGGVKPKVIGIWLDVSGSHDGLIAALKSKSRISRECAIIKLGQLLRSPQWETTWLALGGVSGWLQLLQRSSKENVKQLLHALRRAHRTREADVKKSKYTTELFKALQPDLFSDALYKSEDSRQLRSLYILLLPVCNTETVMHFLDFASDPSNGISHLIRQDELLVLKHFDALRAKVVDGALEAGPFNPSKKEQNMESWVNGWRSRLLSTYPPEPSMKYHAWSASMEFAYELLRKLAKASDPGMSAASVRDEIVFPLLRRSLEHRAGTASHLMVLDAVVEYIDSHKRGSGSLTVESLNRMLLTLWSRKPDTYDRILKRWLGFMRRPSQFVYHTLTQPQNLLHMVRGPLRYRLLRLIALHQVQPGVDIDNVHDVDVKSFHCDVLLKLERAHARTLLARLLKATDGRLVFASPPTGWPLQEAGIVETSFLSMYLNRGSVDAIDHARERIAEKVSLAKRTRSQADRLAHASAALFYASYSGGIDLLAEVVEFSKRFVRDPEAGISLFNGTNLSRHEHVLLLSGLDGLENNGSVDKTKSVIITANTIVESYISIAFKAMNEPHFRANHWKPIQQMLDEVLDMRMREARKLQEQFAMPDQQVYETLWIPTLELLTAAEAKWITPEFEKLEYRRARWPYKNGLSVEVIKNVPTARFIDELAKRRNDIWAKLRLELDSNVAILTSPWPNGLPIQYLVPHSGVAMVTEVPMDLDQMPYLKSRIENVVFMPREHANAPPPIKEVDRAVDYFIENYPSIAGCWVRAASETERPVRVRKLWEHVISELSDSFESRDDAEEYWVYKLRGLSDVGFGLQDSPFGSGAAKTLPKSINLLPKDADYEQVNDWDPVVHDLTSARKVTWKETAIHTCLDYTDYDAWANGIGKKNECRSSAGSGQFWTTVDYRPDCFFALQDQRKFHSPEHVESELAAALLFLEYKKGDPVRVLRKAFPLGFKTKRFPPLLLDADLVSDLNTKSNNAIQLLDAYRHYVPCQILLTIAEGAVERLKVANPDDTGLAEVREIAFRCLGLVIKGDLPSSAQKISLDAITSLPDSSSWHRSILNKGFLHVLAPQEAVNFIMEFADYVIKTQTVRREAEKKLKASGKSEEEIDEEVKKLPFVKVTTIKQMAQLLYASDIFGLDTAIELLMQMLDSFSQLDVRDSVLQSILGLIRESPESALTEKTYEILIIKLGRLKDTIGGLNERYATNEAFWTKVKLTEPLPEIGEEFPLWERLVAASTDDQLPARLREFIKHEILLPSLSRSIDSIRRWSALYVKKHNIELDVEGLPMLPANKPALEQMIKLFRTWIPQSYLETWWGRCTFELVESAPVSKICSEIRRDLRISGSMESKQWLSYVDHEKGGKALDSGTTLLRDIFIGIHENPKSAISADFVRTCLCDLIKMVIEQGDTKLVWWTMFASKFQMPHGFHHLPVTWKAWDLNLWVELFRPLISEFQNIVESYRTPAWQKGGGTPRFPLRLPDPIDLKLCLVRHVDHHLRRRAQQEAIEHMVANMLALLSERAKTRPATIHYAVDRLVGLVNRHFEPEKSELILKLGDLKQSVMLGEGLDALATKRRIYFAATCLKSTGRLLDDAQRQKVRRMVDTWMENPDEEISELGWNIFSHHMHKL